MKPARCQGRGVVWAIVSSTSPPRTPYDGLVSTRISEQALLQRALRDRLITEPDLAAVTPDEGAAAHVARFGQRVAALIQRGRLSESVAERLYADITSTHPSPAAETLDAAQFGETIDGDSAAVQPLGLAQTISGDAASVVVHSSVNTSAFPVPNWDRYEFLQLLGRGGMGAVYKARDRRLGRLVALKFLHGDNPVQIQRFMQEARAQSRLEAPHICKVYEVGLVENKPYIAMQLVDGLPLDVACRGLSLLQKVQVLVDVAEAMHTAHEQGIVHRDIKPSNIMVTRSLATDGSVSIAPVVMDFGLARESNAGGGLTESGDVLGTPAYMSPEQARGEARRLDRRTDVYSLGATLYDVLVGKPPFEDETVVNIILKVMNDEPQPLRSHDPTVPEPLELIVSKCLNKEAEQRYPTAQALAEDLRRFLSSQRVSAKRLSLGYRLRYWARHNRALATLAGALVLSLLGLAGFGARTYLVNLRREREAKREAELAKQLGQDVNDIEWRVRTAYSLPLHDTGPDKARVRARMSQVEQQIRTYGAVGTRLGHFVLGRGHLALHEFDRAFEHLKKAEALGVTDLELDYALGRVLGEKFNQALEDARKSGDRSFFERRRKEIEAEFLAPALDYLNKSRRLESVPAKYLDGLIDYYKRRYDAALLNAQFALRQDPWLYEALELQGHVHMARALDRKDHGDTEQAEHSFQAAITAYDRAAEIGRSDYRLYEAIAEAWIRQEEMDLFRGVNPEPKFQHALAAADRALEAAPLESHGDTKKAFATYFRAQHAQFHDQKQEAMWLYEQQASHGERALGRHPDDAYAHENIGMSYRYRAQILRDIRRTPHDLLNIAYRHYERALKINPRFAWAYNDYGAALSLEAEWMVSHNEAPHEILRRQMEMTRRAIEIDPDYLFAWINLSVANINLARWQMEHGVSPETAAADGLKSIQMALNINKTLAPLYGNIGFLYLTIAKHEIDKLSQDKTASQLAIDRYLTGIKLGASDADAYRSLASAYHGMAMHEVLGNQDPSDAMKSGLAAVDECYKKQPQHVECQASQAQLLMVLADWQRKQGRPFLATVMQAHGLAQRAAAQGQDNEEVLLIFGEACLQRASAQSGRQPDSAKAVQQGIAALDRALGLVVGWPRALALRGALLVLRGRLEAGVERQQSFEQARRAMAEAFAGNPLLKGRFGTWAEEAERLAQSQ